MLLLDRVVDGQLVAELEACVDHAAQRDAGGSLAGGRDAVEHVPGVAEVVVLLGL